MPRRKQRPLNNLLKHSYTVWLGYVKILSGISLLGIDYVHSILSDSGVKDAITAMKFPPYVGLGLAVLGVLVIIARTVPQSNVK